MCFSFMSTWVMWQMFWTLLKSSAQTCLCSPNGPAPFLECPPISSFPAYFLPAVSPVPTLCLESPAFGLVQLSLMFVVCAHVLVFSMFPPLFYLLLRACAPVFSDARFVYCWSLRYFSNRLLFFHVWLFLTFFPFAVFSYIKLCSGNKKHTFHLDYFCFFLQAINESVKHHSFADVNQSVFRLVYSRWTSKDLSKNEKKTWVSNTDSSSRQDSVCQTAYFWDHTVAAGPPVLITSQVHVQVTLLIFGAARAAPSAEY